VSIEGTVSISPANSLKRSLESSVTFPMRVSPVTLRLSAAAVVRKDDAINSVRRKTAVYEDQDDPAYFERGALICHPIDASGDLRRTAVLVIDGDIRVLLTADSPIRIGEPEECEPLEPFLFNTGTVPPDHDQTPSATS
jgi:hypothetical protein